MYRLIAAISAALIALFAADASFAASPAEYLGSELGLGARLVSHDIADVNGDGLMDVVAACVEDGPDDGPKNENGAPRRTFRIFYQKRGGTFAKAPDATLNIPPDAAVYDTGDITGGGAESVCYMAPDGIYAFKGAKPVRIIETSSVFVQADPYGIPRLPLFAGIPSGADAALVQRVGSLDVFLKGPKGYSLSAGLDTPAETTYGGGPRVGADGTMTVSHRLPSLSLGGYASKDSSDLILAWDDKADVYAGRKGGGFNSNKAVEFRPGLMDAVKKGPMDSSWLAPVDMDGDGRLDFVVTKKTGGVAHTRSLIFVYIRDKAGRLPAKPTHTIITEGVVGPRFVDLNGDNRLDIMLPSVKVGVRNFVNILTSGEVGVDVAIYIQKPDGTYPDTPDGEKRVTFELDLDSIGSAVPVLETGRFSKDGGYGLAVVSEEDRVELYMPDRYSYISDRPGLELEVAGPSELDVKDINGDGVDDLVMTYVKSGRKPDTINVFISK